MEMIGVVVFMLLVFLLIFTLRLHTFAWVQRRRVHEVQSLATNDLRWHEPAMDLHPDEERAIIRAQIVLANRS